MLPKYSLWVGLLLLFAALYTLTHGLTQPIYNDERHFWPTVQLFAAAGWPTRTLLCAYSELNTPLPFVVLGWAEAALHRGIWLARLVNLLGGLGMLLLFLHTGRHRPHMVLIAVAGVLLNPYFYITSLYVYTDCLPMGLVLLGLYGYTRQRHWLSALAFGLAICGRQYLVVFPTGILVWEGLGLLRNWLTFRKLPSADGLNQLLTYGAACGVLVGWRLFWGNWAPPAEVAEQHIQTGQWHPEFGLYGLACLAVYYVLPAQVGQRLVTGLPLPAPLSARWLLVAAVLIGVLCATIRIQPGANQIPPFLGPLDRLLTIVLPTGWLATAGRQLIYAGLILVAVRRCTAVSLPAVWLVLHVLIWSKAHVGWDKYTYPLVMAYWYWLLLSPATQQQAAERRAGSRHTRSDLGKIPVISTTTRKVQDVENPKPLA